MIIVDSSVWIDYLAKMSTPESRWLDAAVAREEIALTDMILCEVLRGVRTRPQFHLVRWELTRYTVFNTGGEELAVLAAENFRELRGRGYTIRTLADCVIATFCIQNDHTLLHSDRDFDAFEKHLGLSVVQVR